MYSAMRLAAVILFVIVSVFPAYAAKYPSGIKPNDTAIGTVLSNNAGMTLYTFDEDKPGGSACYGKCAENWPPLKAPASAAPVGDFSIVTRQDGIAQWAYKGKPLYLWVRDKGPGETSGDGVRGWRVARP